MPTEIASLYASVGADTSGLKKGLEDAGKMLGKTEQEMGKLGGASQKADKSIGGLMSVLKVAAVVSFAKQVGEAAYELGVLGAQAERTEKTFLNVAGGSGQAAVMLDALREATLGTRSEVELMASATNILALGLADNAADLSSIVRNVEALGARFGGNMQIFQLMMSNDSLMRIDSFGIGVEEATKRIEEYKAAGMEAGEAFDTAILDLMTEKFEQLGGAMEDPITDIQRTQAAWQDLRAEAGKAIEIGGISEASAKFTRWLADTLGRVNDLSDMYGEAAVKAAYHNTVYAYGAQGQRQGLDDLEQGYLDVQNAQRGMQASGARLTAQATAELKQMAQRAAAVRKVEEALLGEQIALRSTNGVMVESLDVWNQYIYAQKKGAESINYAAAEMARQRQLAENQTRADLILAAVNSDLTEGLEERADSLIDLRAEQADILTQIDKLSAAHGRAIVVQQKASLTEAEATLTTLQLADAQAKLAAETDPLKAAQLAVKIEDLQGKLGGATEATTTFVDNTKKIDELKGKYGDLADEIAEVEGAIRGSIQAQLFQMTVSKMMEGGINDAELAYLELAGAAMGLDTTFLHLERMSSNLAGALADDALTGEDAAKAAERAWGGTASTIDHITKKYTTNAEEREAAYSSALSAASEAARAEAELGNAADNAGGSIGMMAGAVTDAKDKLADISPAPIEEVGSAAFSTGETVDTLPDRMLSWQEVMDQMHPGGIPDVGLSMDETGGKVLDALGNVIRLQQEIDNLHGKSVEIKTIYTEEDRRHGYGLGAGASSLNVPIPDEQNASGGWLNTGSTSLVGERGPEMIYATSAGVQIEPLSGAGAGDGAALLGATWTGDIVIQGVSDPEAAANAVIRKLADRGIVRAGGYR